MLFRSPRPNKNRPIMPVKIKRAYAMNKKAGIALIPIAIPIARRDDFFLGGIGGGTGMTIGCCVGGIGAPVDYSVVCIISTLIISKSRLLVYM